MLGKIRLILVATAWAVELAPASAAGAYPDRFLLEGGRLYAQGDPRNAVAAYAAAVQQSPGTVEGWLNGALLWAELGELDKAADWFSRASQLSPQDAEVLTALGEAELRRGRLEPARKALSTALEVVPNDAYALVALGRVELAAGRPAQASSILAKAVEAAPQLTLASYWLGKAREEAKDVKGALEAYKRAAFGDSYFVHARHQFALMLVKSARHQEAWEQTQRLLNAEPGHRAFQRLLHALEPEVGKRQVLPAPAKPAKEVAEPLPMSPPPKGRVPVLRVGLATTALGRPIPRHATEFSCSTPFALVEARSGRVLARGREKQAWQARSTRIKKSWMLELSYPDGKMAARTAAATLIRPDVSRGGITTLRFLPGLERRLRGQIELSPAPRGVKAVNVVDLESYTHGVVAAEMPISSPMEALKAQAVVARTHALFIQQVSKRHARDGYDVCDGQHCQVYAGTDMESGRSRAVVDATRGRVVTFHGRVAHVLYASNCGGHTQSGFELKGWADLPYWKGVMDASGDIAPPSSPWELRLWLRRRPSAYCQPSSFVHAAHFRWTRVLPAADIQEKLDRALKIGQLQRIQPLKRSASGHLNSILVQGSKATRVVASELRIRSLLGIGSQRSSLFIMEADYDAGGRPKTFTFYGGGWGHGVGMCQSGAMGRAETGQSYADILLAYYPGVELGNLRY